MVRLFSKHFFKSEYEFKAFNIIKDLTARLSWINWENLGVHPGRRTLLTSLALTGDPNLSHPQNHKYGI